MISKLVVLFQILVITGLVLSAGAWRDIAPSSQNANANIGESLTSACDQVSPTPFLTIVYGYVDINGKPAPVGTTVQAVTPRGEIAGCFALQNPGILALTQIYGSSQGDPGVFLPNEPIQFQINYQKAYYDLLLSWSDDKDIHRINLSVYLLYMPVIGK